MAALTDKQFFFMAGAALLGISVAVYQARKLAPALGNAISQAGTEAKGAVSTLANAPLQAFRDPLADSDTVGTEAWAAQQVADLQKWLGINQPKADPASPYQGNRADPDSELPLFESGVIVPYMPTRGY